LDVRTLRRTGAVVLLLAFGILLGLWVRSRVPAFDQAILDFAVAHRRAAWTNFFRAATLCGGTPAVTVITVVVAAAAVWRRWWTLAGQAVVAGAGAAVLVVAGKSAFGRPRPPAATQLGVLQSLSYPSGHALGSMVAATLLLALVFAATRAGPGAYSRCCWWRSTSWGSDCPGCTWGCTGAVTSWAAGRSAPRGGCCASD